MRPLVSIHVITYNHVHFIGPAIESALAQDYRPIQIVVADDGSNDGTGEIVADYANRFPDEVIGIVGPRVGVLENSNRALFACTGEYVAVLNGDDLFLPGKLSKQVAWMEEDRRRVLCAHDVEHFESDTGETLYRHFARSQPFAGVGPATFLERGGPFATVSVMVRRSAVPTAGFDPRMKASLDYKFWIDCLAGGGEFGYLPDVLARYRLHSGGFHRTRAMDIQTDLLVARTIFESEHPEFAPECRRGRANQYYRMAVEELSRGDARTARLYLRAAMDNSLVSAPRAPAMLAMTYVPSGIRERVFDARRRRTEAKR